MDARLVCWAAVITALGWEYAAFASCWPSWFDQEATQHGVREEAGYRIGWLILWRLPARAARLVILVSALPLLVATLLRGWLVIAVLAAATGVVLSLWFIGSPGTRLARMEIKRPGGGRAFELRRDQNWLRSTAVFVVCGLVPALLVGAAVLWAVLRLTT
jgi:hypothetical protein